MGSEVGSKCVKCKFSLVSGMALPPGMGLPPAGAYPGYEQLVAAQHHHEMYVREATLRAQGMDMQR